MEFTDTNKVDRKSGGMVHPSFVREPEAQARLYRLRKNSFLEGYGLQAVRKSLAMNSALAAEGLLRSLQHFFQQPV
jgi:hypothetical protein